MARQIDIRLCPSRRRSRIGTVGINSFGFESTSKRKEPSRVGSGVPKNLLCERQQCEDSQSESESCVALKNTEPGTSTEDCGDSGSATVDPVYALSVPLSHRAALPRGVEQGFGDAAFPRCDPACLACALAAGSGRSSTIVSNSKGSEETREKLESNGGVRAR